LGELPDAKIAIKFKDDTEWFTRSHSLDYMNDNYFMKERELTWEDVFEMWRNINLRIYTSLGKWLQENCEPPKLKKK
jgi:hypothetical protein